MKYIRTKDKVLKVRKPFADEYTDNTHIHCYEHPMVHKRDIIKQADTIEELCDAFVDTSELKTTNTGGWLYDEFDSKNKCLVYYVEDEKRTIPLTEYDDLSKVYGAIWTDKGLIYVAKMNDKGELELL